MPLVLVVGVAAGHNDRVRTVFRGASDAGLPMAVKAGRSSLLPTVEVMTFRIAGNVAEDPGARHVQNLCARALPSEAGGLPDRVAPRWCCGPGRRRPRGRQAPTAAGGRPQGHPSSVWSRVKAVSGSQTDLFITQARPSLEAWPPSDQRTTIDLPLQPVRGRSSRRQSAPGFSPVTFSGRQRGSCSATCQRSALGRRQRFCPVAEPLPGMGKPSCQPREAVSYDLPADMPGDGAVSGTAQPPNCTDSGAAADGRATRRPLPRAPSRAAPSSAFKEASRFHWRRATPTPTPGRCTPHATGDFKITKRHTSCTSVRAIRCVG